MNLKLLFLAAWLVSVICSDAQSVTTAVLVRPILDASTKPYPEFVKVVIQVPLPPLVLPKTAGATEPMAAVSTLVWRRLSKLDLVIRKANNAEAIETMGAMCLLRDFLLKHDAYANILYATYIEATVSRSVLSALSEQAINVKEARQISNQLTKPVTMEAIIVLVERSAPRSITLKQLKDPKAEKLDFLNISWHLSRELGEPGDLFDTHISELIKKEQLSSLISFVANTSANDHLARLLIEFAAKGGNLNSSYEELVAKVKRLTPDALGLIDAATGMKIEATMFPALMENIRNRRPE